MIMQETQYPALDVLWCAANPTALCCCVCEKTFGTDALVRTFRVSTEEGHGSNDSRTISTPLGASLVTYDRHLECLQKENVRYVTVSHVWDTAVSATQDKGRHSPQDDAVQRKVLESPTSIARSISQGVDGDFEVWHDYISVPQWTPQLKTNILQAIHKIYSSAALTVMHFDDVTPAMIRAFTHGKTDEERIQGMLGICNAKWYSRVWTAMEYIRSPKVRFMDSESNIYSDDGAEHLFQNRLDLFWKEQVAKSSSTHELEARMNISDNIMPWSLGPLTLCRDPRSRNFGLAFALLSRRGCQSQYDFLYALHGIVTGSATAAASAVELQRGSWDERYRRIALGCVEAGDYTPLLMTPEWAPGDIEPDVRWMPANNINEGYHDHYAYLLGPMTTPPRHHAETTVEQGGGSPREGRVTMRLQRAGVVSRLILFHELAMEDMMREVAHSLAEPTVEAFLDAYGTRHYFQPRDKLLQSLSQHPGGYERLERTVAALAEIEPGKPWPGEGGCKCEKCQDEAWQIGETRDGDNSDKEQDEKADSTEGEKSDNGSAKSSLKDKDCKSKDDRFYTFWGAMHALGLDETAQADYQVTYANVLHLTWRRYYAWATCQSCGASSMVNAGLYVKEEDALGATMHRIPGLGFERSLEDGVCLLLGPDGGDGAGRRVVGRAVWATPACACQGLDELVAVRLPRLPRPKPRELFLRALGRI
ncbi:hypothetical protein RB601_007956 [Gaeumannomyces tritici]